MLLLFSYTKYRKYVNNVLVLFLLFSFALSWSIKAFIKDEQISINSGVLILLLYCVFIRKRNEGGSCLRDQKYKILKLSLLIIIVLQIFQLVQSHIYIYDNYVFILNTYITILFLSTSLHKLSSYRYKTDYIIYAIIIFSICNSIIGIAQFITGKTLVPNVANNSLRQVGMINRAIGLAGSDNGAGNLGALLLPAALYNYNKIKNTKNLAIVIINLIFVFITFTRIGYLAVIVELAIYYLIKSKITNRRDILRLLLIIAMCTLAVGFLYNDYFDRLYGGLFSERGDSHLERLRQYPMAFSAFSSSPVLGTGAGQYNAYILDNLCLYDKYEIHSQLLNILVEQGVLAFVVFLYFYCYLFYSLLRKVKDRNMLFFVIALFTGNLIVTNFNPNQYYLTNNFIYYFINFGLLFTSGNNNESK